MSDFKAKMHPNRFRLGLCSRPRWGSLHVPQAPWLYLRGLLLRGRRGKGKGKGRGGEGKGRAGKGGMGENDLTHPLSQIPGYATDFTA